MIQWWLRGSCLFFCNWQRGMFWGYVQKLLYRWPGVINLHASDQTSGASRLLQWLLKYTFVTPRWPHFDPTWIKRWLQGDPNLTPCPQDNIILTPWWLRSEPTVTQQWPRGDVLAFGYYRTYSGRILVFTDSMVTSKSFVIIKRNLDASWYFLRAPP